MVPIKLARKEGQHFSETHATKENSSFTSGLQTLPLFSPSVSQPAENFCQC